MRFSFDPARLGGHGGQRAFFVPLFVSFVRLLRARAPRAVRCCGRGRRSPPSVLRPICGWPFGPFRPCHSRPPLRRKGFLSGGREGVSAPLTKAQGNSVDVTWDEIIQMNPIHRSVVCPIEIERINGRAGQFDGHPSHNHFGHYSPFAFSISACLCRRGSDRPRIARSDSDSNKIEDRREDFTVLRPNSEPPVVRGGCECLLRRAWMPI